MTNRFPRLLLATSAALAFGALGCGDEHAAAPTEEAAPVAVSASRAELETVTEPIFAAGGVEAWSRVSPGTKILGRISLVLVEEGDRVDQGQLLAKLEDGDLVAAVEQARAAVAMAEAQLTNAAAQDQRMLELHSRGSVTDKGLEDATAGRRVAEAALAQAQANLAAARVTLGYAEIRSPLAGWVAAKMVEAGDMAAPGRPFFVVEELSRVKVSVEVGEEIVASLARGDHARVKIGGIDGELDAVVHRVVPAGDPATRTFSVKLALDNPDGKIRSGAYARARFAGGSRQALTVPGTALLERGQLEGLYVVEDGRARLRWVRRGGVFGDRVEILSGLEGGELYLARPPAGLADGAPVTVGGA